MIKMMTFLFMFLQFFNVPKRRWRWCKAIKVGQMNQLVYELIKFA